MLGWGGVGCLLVGLGGLLGGWEGAPFWGGIFLSCTGESANQADEWEVRGEEHEEEEEESVEDFEEGSEEDSPGSLFLFLGGGWKGLCFWVLGVCFGLGVGVCFGLGGRFWDQDGALGLGGGSRFGGN